MIGTDEPVEILMVIYAACLILIIVIGVTAMIQDNNQYHAKLVQDAKTAIELVALDGGVSVEQVLDSMEELFDMVNHRIIDLTEDRDNLGEM